MIVVWVINIREICSALFRWICMRDWNTPSHSLTSCRHSFRTLFLYLVPETWSESWPGGVRWPLESCSWAVLGVSECSCCQQSCDCCCLRISSRLYFPTLSKDGPLNRHSCWNHFAASPVYVSDSHDCRSPADLFVYTQNIMLGKTWIMFGVELKGLLMISSFLTTDSRWAGLCRCNCTRCWMFIWHVLSVKPASNP